jgi:hypothetical protein
METTSHQNGPHSLESEDRMFGYQAGFKAGIERAAAIALTFKGKGKAERLAHGITLGRMASYVAIDIVSEERGGDIVAQLLNNALREVINESRCSQPGCGYPDGKPCHGCGLIIPMADGVRIEWMMKRCHRAAKTLSEFASLVNENPTRKQLVHTLAEAINMYDRHEVDRLMELEEEQLNPRLTAHEAHNGH